MMLKEQIRKQVRQAIAEAIQTTSLEFKRWFGNSVITLDGRAGSTPLIVYRGSLYEPLAGEYGDSTTTSPQKLQGAYWFSSNPSVASGFADPAPFSIEDMDVMGMAPNVSPAYLQSTNPLIVDARNRTWAEIEFEGKLHFTDGLVNIAKSRGHDGLVVFNVMEGGGSQRASTIVVFSRNQIWFLSNT